MANDFGGQIGIVISFVVGSSTGLRLASNILLNMRPIIGIERCPLSVKYLCIALIPGFLSLYHIIHPGTEKLVT